MGYCPCAAIIFYAATREKKSFEIKHTVTVRTEYSTWYCKQYGNVICEPADSVAGINTRSRYLYDWLITQRRQTDHGARRVVHYASY